jgi:hypothetical protein
MLPHLLPKNDPRFLRWKKSLKKRPPPWNKGKTKKSDPNVNKISETFKRKGIDNFAVWRQNARSIGLIPTTRELLKKTTNLAFLIGLTLGDGNINKMARTECLRITLGTDKPKLWKYAVQIIENVFNKKPSTNKRSAANCMNVTLYQQNLSKRLEIPLGARKNLEIKLPTWVWKNKKMLISAVSGLFEAEGYCSIHKPTYTYNMGFSNMNISLLDEMEKALKDLGFHPERRVNAVRLRKKKEVFEFQKIISFRKYPLI